MQTNTVMGLAKIRDWCASGEAKRLREQVGRLSLSEVASVVGTSPVSVWRWENGQKRPHGQQALRYLRLLERLKKHAENGHAENQKPPGAEREREPVEAEQDHSPHRSGRAPPARCD